MATAGTVPPVTISGSNTYSGVTTVDTVFQSLAFNGHQRGNIMLTTNVTMTGTATVDFQSFLVNFAVLSTTLNSNSSPPTVCATNSSLGRDRHMSEVGLDLDFFCVF